MATVRPRTLLILKLAVTARSRRGYVVSDKMNKTIVVLA